LEGLLRIWGSAVLGVESQKWRGVAGGNETAVRGQVTTANDEMRGGLAAAD
jgi:hypothetical protein